MLLHRLALALGMTVEELRERMGSRELSAWMALWRIDPWGDQRADARQAMTTAAVLAGHGRRSSPDEFMPWPARRRGLTQRELEARLDAMARRSPCQR